MEYQFKNPDVVKEIEIMYPEMMDEYKRIMWEQYEIFCSKQKNYGPSNISVGTSLQTSEDKKLSLTGIWFRCMDKINRWKQMVLLKQLIILDLLLLRDSYRVNLHIRIYLLSYRIS